MNLKATILTILTTLSISSFAQQKPKLAVYVTGDDALNVIVANRLVDGLAHNGKYTAVERTAGFLSALSKEHGYQRSGNVDDDQIAALGKQFAVQYVCVATISTVWGNEKYISARIIDAETAEVVASGSTNGSVSTSSELINRLNALSNSLLGALDYSKTVGAKKVAVYVTKSGNRDVDIIIGDQLVAGFAKSGKYLAIERTSRFLSELSKEVNYQQSGAVDDNELVRLGKQAGVQYVCVAITSTFGGDYFITSRLIDVQSANIVNTHSAEGKRLNSSQSVITIALEIAEKLSGRTIEEEAAFQKAEAIRKQEEEEKRREEEQRKRKEEEERRNEAKRRITINVGDISFEMIKVEAGTFTMGCTSEQNNCENNESPYHRVTISKDYYIGKFEVTQELYRAVMGYILDPVEGSNIPVVNVSWTDAQQFCTRLSEMTGRKFSLPTEAEWEYAARGGEKRKSTKYSGSSSVSDVAWYFFNNDYDYRGTVSPHKVGQLNANELGIYDMSGNVREWCQDWYGRYSSASQIDPKGPDSGSGRVIRGGSYISLARSCRVTNRDYEPPSYGFLETGFRVVMHE